MNESAATASHEELLRLLAGCWISRAICVAGKLGIADLLQDGPRSAEEIAAATGTRAGPLYRVLRALACIGVFQEEGERRFRLTPLADRLRTGSPGSLRALAVLLGEPEHWRSWEGLLHSLRTERPAFDEAFGMPLFRYLEAHPDAARSFDDAMTSRSNLENAAILSAYDFPAAGVVVDVGGGQGTLVDALLAAHPALHGVVFDRPHVIEAARARSGRAPDRRDLVAGDFFRSLPAYGDIYLLKRVIHDWGDEQAGLILASCRTAMRDSGRLLLIEPVVPAGNDYSFSKWLDLLMLVWHAGGRERTERELEALLVSARLRLERTIPTHAGVHIIEAVPA